MANLIDYTVFVGDINISQRSEAEVAANINAYITKHEPIFLECLLGYELYKDFLANVVSSPEYQALRDGGQEFTTTRGYKTKSVSIKKPLAQYIYFQYMKDQFSFTSGSGEKAIEVAGTVNSNAAWKMVRAWNQMVEWNLNICDYLEVKKDEFTFFAYTPDSLGILRGINVFNI
jgi:hypothetical protein